MKNPTTTFLGNFKLFWFWTNIFIPRWCSINFWNKCTICHLPNLRYFRKFGLHTYLLEANLSPYLWKFLNQASATLGLGRENSCNFDRLTFLMMFGLHSLLLIFAFVEILTFSDVLSDREYLLSAATPRCFFKDHFSLCQETRCIKPDTSSQKFRHHHPCKKTFSDGNYIGK